MELPDDPEAFVEGDYLVELERLLLDELDDGMLLAELDGYVTGLCISGDPVPPERWIAEVWNGGSAPIDDPVTALRLIGLIIRHRDRVSAALEVPGTYAPIFDLDPDTGATFALTWTAGFDVAMRIAPTGFNRLRASNEPTIIEAMAAICRLIAADADPSGATDADYDALDALADERLAGWVEALYAGKLDWRNAGTKVGRNDPCPCGSGRKYKKCCAA